METVRLDLGMQSYDVVVGSGIVSEAPALFEKAGIGGLPRFVLADEGVAQKLPEFISAIQARSPRSQVEIVPSGEGSKSLEMFTGTIDRLARFERGEGALVVAVGGGVVGDLSGFVAACYKRGTSWAQIPTTLLAQVDASVGGKSAVNHPTAKNLIGAFHQPSLVIADMCALTTLPDRELRSGLAEVIKHGVIADLPFFERIEATISEALTRAPGPLEDYVATSCRIKGAAVMADERDTTGRRATLNYGHTFGHAIELAAHFQYAHGEAIAIGMACAGDMAVRMGILDPAQAWRIEALMERAGLPVQAEGVAVDDIMTAMKLDKKFQHGANRFVLAHRIGEVALYSKLPEGVIREVIADRCR